MSATSPASAADPAPVLHGERVFAPTRKTERIASIDFIRGLALLGILLVNVAFLFGPIGTLFEPVLINRMAPPDRFAYLAVVSLCQGKFISIFSMLFGYGLLGQIEKAAAAGRSPAGFVLRRLGALALFGFLHGVLIWYGDVLFIYATMGGWLLLARARSARTLLIAAACFLLFSAGLRAGLEQLGALQETAAVAAGDGARGWDAIWRAKFDPSSPVWIQAEVAAYRDGPWKDAETFRLVEWLINLAITAISGGWQVLGMFLVGAAMWRARFFAPEHHALRRRVLLVCLPLGVVLEAAAGWCFWTTGLTDRCVWAVGGGLQGLSVCFLPIGYLAGLALLADRLPVWLRDVVCSAGRMALTVYLLESVVCAALAYHWGLSWFGRIGALHQVLLAFTVWTALALFAWVYLRWFDQGPMEALWRRMEYGRTRERKP